MFLSSVAMLKDDKCDPANRMILSFSSSTFVAILDAVFALVGLQAFQQSHHHLFLKYAHTLNLYVLE